MGKITNLTNNVSADIAVEPPTNSKPVIEHLQRSAIVIALRLLAILFMLDVIYAVIIVGFLGLNDLHEWHNSYVLFLLLAQIVKYLLLSVLVIRLFVDWAGRSYYLSGHHLIERIGLITITETTHELSQVKSVVVKQGWLGRRFNYGTIRLSLAGSDEQNEVKLTEINNPYKYKQYFDEHLQLAGWVR